MTRDFEKGQGDFLRHEPCPECGSANNVGVWRDKKTGLETKTCFTEGCNFKVTTASLYRASQPGEALPESWLKGKGLTAEVAKLYRITREGKVIYFGFASAQGKLVGLAGRNYAVSKSSEKHFFWKQKTPGTLLYGMDVPKSDICVLVSGLWDAPSAYILSGYTAVSLPDGDGSAKNAVTECYQWLRQFKRVYIVFDNDTPGQAAAQKVIDILGYRARNVILPDYVVSTDTGIVTLKDSNDYLVYGMKQEWLYAVQKAENSINPYIVGSEIDDIYAEYKRSTDAGLSFGIPELDNLLRLRNGEFTVLFGSPGRGKSTFTRHLVASLVEQGIKPYFISLEDPLPHVVDSLVTCVLREPTQEHTVLSRDELISLSRRVREKVSIAHLEHITPEILQDALECAYVMYNARVILLDHLTWLSNLSSDPRAETVKYLNVIAEFVKKFPAHVFVVAHNKPVDVSLIQAQSGKKFTGNREDWEEYINPTPRDAQWSSAIEQVAWNILGWKKPNDPDTPARIYVLKNRTGGMSKLGTVQLYFDDTYKRYLGIDAHAKKMQGKTRDVSAGWGDISLPLAAREASTGSLSPSDNPEPEDNYTVYPEDRSLERKSPVPSEVTPEEGTETVRDDTDTRDSRPTKKVHSKTVEPGLHMSENGVDNRVQGTDGQRLPSDSGDVQTSVSRVIQQIQNTLHEAQFLRAETQKHIPGMGRRDRASVGVLRPAKEAKSGQGTGILALPEIPIDGKWGKFKV